MSNNEEPCCEICGKVITESRYGICDMEACSRKHYEMLRHREVRKKMTADEKALFDSFDKIAKGA